MLRFLKLAHLIGLSAFLGSILTFIVISVAMKGQAPEQVALARALISTSTHALTLPGLWVLVMSGLALCYRQRGGGSRHLRPKFLLAVALLVNAHLIVVPAVDRATLLAAQSAVKGQMDPAYAAAYARESTFGGINLFLTLSAMVLASGRRPGDAS